MYVHIHLLTYPVLETELRVLRGTQYNNTVTFSLCAQYVFIECTVRTVILKLDNCVFVLHSNVYMYRHACVHVCHQIICILSLYITVHATTAI